VSSSQQSRISKRRSHLDQPTNVTTKKIKFEEQPGHVAFLSDSMLKFLIEDCVTEDFILKQNYENNLSILRGAVAKYVVDKSVSLIESWTSSGVNKLIACFGTNDINNIAHTNLTTEEIATQVADAAFRLRNITRSKNIKLLYVMRRFSGAVSETGTENFALKLHTLLNEEQTAFVKTTEEMSSFAGTGLTYEQILDKCTTDNTHWSFDKGNFTKEHNKIY
jgi:hypothetical protein